MGTQLPPSKNGHSLTGPLFGPCLLWPNSCMDQEYKMPLGTQVGLGPGHIVLHGDPAPPKEAPQFLVHVYCGQTVDHLSYCWALVNDFSVAVRVSARFSFSDRWRQDFPTRGKWNYMLGSRHVGTCFAIIFRKNFTKNLLKIVPAYLAPLG